MILCEYIFIVVLRTKHFETRKYLSEDNFLCFKVFDDIFVYAYNLCTHLVSLTLSTTEPSFSETCLVLRM